jgi:hypothetical protein
MDTSIMRGLDIISFALRGDVESSSACMEMGMEMEMECIRVVMRKHVP